MRYLSVICIITVECTFQVLELYTAVLARLSDSERTKLQRSMGLKIEQLKVRSHCP